MSKKRTAKALVRILTPFLLLARDKAASSALRSVTVLAR